MAGGTIQLGGAQNFINQAGSNPFTNRNGGRSLVYSAGQRFDTPYNFAGLNGFGGGIWSGLWLDAEFGKLSRVFKLCGCGAREWVAVWIVLCGEFGFGFDAIWTVPRCEQAVSAECPTV